MFIDSVHCIDLTKTYNFNAPTLVSSASHKITGKNIRFPFLDILGYLKNTHKNPKFGKVRQVPTREFPTKFPVLTLANLGVLWVFFKYPKISKNGNLIFFPMNHCKMWHSNYRSKDTAFLMKKQLHTINLFAATYNVCPLAIP